MLWKLISLLLQLTFTVVIGLVRLGLSILTIGLNLIAAAVRLPLRQERDVSLRSPEPVIAKQEHQPTKARRVEPPSYKPFRY